MTGIPCYRCNEEMTDEEMGSWEPFGLCRNCKVDIELVKAQEEADKREIRMYWQLPAHWQAKLKEMYRK